MNLRFFSDHCVPAEITARLRSAGHTVTELRDALPVNSPDRLVVAKARELDAVLLSLNGDFTDTVTYPPSHFSGIVGLQLHNHPEIIPQLMTRLLAFLVSHPEQDFYHGKLLLVEVHRIRNLKLALHRPSEPAVGDVVLERVPSATLPDALPRLLDIDESFFFPQPS